MTGMFKRMFGFIGGMRSDKSLIGIEISAHSVRMVVLFRHRESFYVKACDVQHFYGDGVDARQSALSKLLIKHNLSQGCIAIVPDAPVMMRMIRLPSGLSEGEIELHIRLDAHKYIPQALDEVSFDFWVMDDDGETLLVLLAAVREAVIDDCVQLASSVSLELSVVDVHEHALARALSPMVASLSGQVAVVHVDDTKTYLYVAECQPNVPFAGFVHRQEYLFGVWQSLDKSDLASDELPKTDMTQAVQTPASQADTEVLMDFDEFLASYTKENQENHLSADNTTSVMNNDDGVYELRFDGGLEGAKRDLVTDFGTKAPTALSLNESSSAEPIKDKSMQVGLADKIEKLLSAYESTTQQTLSAVILSGWADESLVEQLRQLELRDIRLANPFEGMDINRMIGRASLDLAPCLMVACGAAMRADEQGVH